jgi:hypothetical protein
MNLYRILALAAMMVCASTAFAGADINKCVTPDGHVTLTDEACPGGEQTVKVVNGQSDADEAMGPGRAGAPRYTVARMPPRHAELVRGSAPSRGLSLDANMLKMARARLQLIDLAAQAQRAQRLAGLP